MENELRGVNLDLPSSQHLDASKYDHLELALSEYGEEFENLLPKFKERGLTHRSLSALCDDDLRLLGVADPWVRRLMLRNFAEHNRKPHTFDLMMQEIDKTQYNNNVLQGIGNHLNNISKLIMATKLKMDISQPQNVIINGDMWSSTAALKTLDQIEVNLKEMEDILNVLEPKQSNRFVTALFLTTCTSFVGLGIFIAIKLLMK